MRLPWLSEPVRITLQTQRGHALLIHGPRGIGQFEMALTLAQAWLCQNNPDREPCGVCTSCHLVNAKSHPDLLILLPEALRESLGWATEAEPKDGEDATKGSKVKASKEIKVDEVRNAVAFSQTTAARGRGKVVLIHPAERMNAISANALLKTLEEPPGEARFILCCAALDALLPTVRSRCHPVLLKIPETDVAISWLTSHQVTQPEVLLAATGGQPLEVLESLRDGVDSAAWSRLPMQLRAGEVGNLASWPLPRLLDALQKVCHDTMCLTCGAEPRYFVSAPIPRGASMHSLSAWAASLTDISRHADHPWSQQVMVESLVLQAHQALKLPASDLSQSRSPSIHSIQ